MLPTAEELPITLVQIKFVKLRLQVLFSNFNFFIYLKKNKKGGKLVALYHKKKTNPVKCAVNG